MGTVPLLTREGEVEIAKRIERGQLRVLKAISRSPIVIREIVALGDDLKRGVRNIKEVVVFDEEEVTEEILHARIKQTVTRVDALIKHQKKAALLEEKLETLTAKTKAKEHRKTRYLVLAGEGPHFADRSRTEVHQCREEAPARQGEQDRRLHEDARAPDQVARREA